MIHIDLHRVGCGSIVMSPYKPRLRSVKPQSPQYNNDVAKYYRLDRLETVFDLSINEAPCFSTLCEKMTPRLTSDPGMSGTFSLICGEGIAA